MKYKVSVLHKVEDGSSFDDLGITKRKQKSVEPKLVPLTTIEADYYEFVEPERPGKAFLRNGSAAINFFTTTPGDHFWNGDRETLVARLPEGDWVIEAVTG